MTIDNHSADNNNLIKFNHYGDDDKMYPLKKIQPICQRRNLFYNAVFLRIPK